MPPTTAPPATLPLPLFYLPHAKHTNQHTHTRLFYIGKMDFEVKLYRSPSSPQCLRPHRSAFRSSRVSSPLFSSLRLSCVRVCGGALLVPGGVVSLSRAPSIYLPPFSPSLVVSRCLFDRVCLARVQVHTSILAHARHPHRQIEPIARACRLPSIRTLTQTHKHTHHTLTYTLSLSLLPLPNSSSDSPPAPTHTHTLDLALDLYLDPPCHRNRTPRHSMPMTSRSPRRCLASRTVLPRPVALSLDLSPFVGCGSRSLRRSGTLASSRTCSASRVRASDLERMVAMHWSIVLIVINALVYGYVRRVIEQELSR